MLQGQLYRIQITWSETFSKLYLDLQVWLGKFLQKCFFQGCRRNTKLSCFKKNIAIRDTIVLVWSS